MKNKYDFTLKQLRIFVEIVTTGSMVTAARVLGMSQPAVSMALSELESTLQEKLFDRWGKRIILNERGRALVPLAKRILADALEVRNLFAAEDQKHQGTLRLGASSTLATYFVPELLSGYLEFQPGVKIQMTSNNKDQVISQLEDFTLDIALIAGNCSNPEIESRFWFQDELCIFCSPEHPLATQPAIVPKDLGAASWILRESGSGTREALMPLISRDLQSLKVVMVLDRIEAIKRAVQIGMGISCLSRMAISQELENGSLIELPTPFYKLTRNHYILIHQQKYHSQLIMAFLNFCQIYEKTKNLPLKN
jgi:DNA-binding transcriptional LysR family regulator